MRERVAKFRSLVVAPVLALAVTTCMWGVANARVFSEKTLHGGYGCLTTIVDEAGVLDQLELDGKGKITSGTGVINLIGEVCTFPVTGSSYTVNSNGTGTMTVLIGTAVPADGDEALLCTLLSGTSLHYAIVVESGGKKVDLTGLDPFFAGAAFTGSDPGEFVLSGACNRQVGG